MVNRVWNFALVLLCLVALSRLSSGQPSSLIYPPPGGGYPPGGGFPPGGGYPPVGGGHCQCRRYHCHRYEMYSGRCRSHWGGGFGGGRLIRCCPSYGPF